MTQTTSATTITAKKAAIHTKTMAILFITLRSLSPGRLLFVTWFASFLR